MRTSLYLIVTAITLLVGGCDRLSEKEKMEMRILCDSEFRKKIAPTLKDQQSNELLSYTNEVQTNYSFSDHRCYGKFSVITKSRASVVAQLSSKTKLPDDSDITVTLFDGITGETLLMSSWEGALFENKRQYVLGSQAATGMTATQAMVLIDKRLTTP